MATVNYTYKDPTTGVTFDESDNLTLELYDAEDGTKKAVLVGSGSGVQDCRIDVTEAANTAIYGNSMEARPGRYMTRLTASEEGLSPPNTTLSVENSGAPTAALPLGLNVVAGDVIQIVDYFKADGSPNATQYLKISSVPGATSIVVDTTLNATYNKGAMLFKLSGTLPLFGTGRGVNKKAGTKTQRESPSMQSYTATPVAGPSGFQITPTADGETQLVRGKVRIYVRSSLDDKHGIIEPSWVPDAEITTFGSSTLVTTYDGGTAAGGGSIAAGQSYTILATREDYTGAVSVATSVSVVAKLAQVAI